MKKFDKRLSLCFAIIFCLLIGAVALFQHFNKDVYHLPVAVAEPKLVPSGNNANPFVGHIFANDKEDGNPSTGKDSIGMEITYINAGNKSASDVKRSVITVLQKDHKLTVHSVDTISWNTPRPSKPGVNMVDEFYLHNFLPADTQFIYVKFDYCSKAGVQASVLREMFTYNHSLLNHHLPATDSATYAGVKKLLLSRHFW